MSASRIYERAVLRPFAEQLVEAAQVQPRQHTAELMPRGDSLALALASLAPGAAALPVHDSRQLREVSAATALALFSVTAATEALAREAASGMGVLLLVWPAPGDTTATVSPSLEHIVAAAHNDVAGAAPTSLEAALRPPQLDGWERLPCTDVCRLDSVRELLSAVCAWYHVALDPAMSDALEERVAIAVAQHTGFDGTLRIPVTALLLRSR